MCVRCCEAALERRSKSFSPLKTKVENEIAVQLPHRQARHHFVAAKLGMSPRTLARRLAAEGLCFADIMVQVRSALADRYLADRSLSISQIAWLLGYAEIGAFTRAFRRWTGMAPTAAQRGRGERPTSAAPLGSSPRLASKNKFSAADVKIWRADLRYRRRSPKQRITGTCCDDQTYCRRTVDGCQTVVPSLPAIAGLRDLPSA